MPSNRSQSTIVWFRQDRRRDDNAALLAAARRAASIILLHVRDPDGEGDWPPGAASR